MESTTQTLDYLPAPPTSLSDLILAHVRTPTPAIFKAFLEQFRRSELGVIAAGMPAGVTQYTTTAQRPVGLGQTRDATGRQMVLAFADPTVFAKNYGTKFNVTMYGDDIFATALKNRKCNGILVNCALAEFSMVINRPAFERLPEVRSKAGMKPWWKMW